MSASRGWFPDPAGRGGYRWWDGSRWTRYLADDPSAPEPQSEPVEAEPAPITRPRRAVPTATETAEAGPAADPAVTAHSGPERPITTPAITAPTGARPAGAYPPGYDGPVRPRRAPHQHPRRRSLLVAIVAVGVLAVVAAVIAVLQQDTKLLYPSASEPTVTPVQDDGSYDDSTRELAIPGMRMTMPDEPYLAVGLTDPRNGVFEPNGGALLGGAYAMAIVQKDYRGTSDWMAMIRAGRVEDSLTEGDDLEEIADRVVEAELSDAFPREVTIKKRKEQTLTDNLPHPTRIINLQVHYDLPGLKSKYDRMSVMVTSRPDGGYNGWIGMRPNNASKKVNDGYTDCTKSLILE